MSLREWLIAIGTLVILAIVIDGLRRMRRARKESMAISSGMGADDLADSPLDDDYNPELPNGGARTVSRDVLEERGYVRSEKPAPRREPKPTRPVVQAAREPAPDEMLDEDAVDDWAVDEPVVDEPAPAKASPRRPQQPAAFSAREEEDIAPDSGWGAAEPDEPASVPEPDPEPPVVTTDVEEDTARRGKTAPRRTNQPLAGANRPEAREVIVINVLARSGSEFKGELLRALFDACGLEHGDMGIYHRHEQTDTTSPVQFSVANAVEPGTFNPEDLDGMKSPGISFFMSLPGPSKPLQAFDFMLETAQTVVRNLGGELKDERRSVMTPQTIEHCRQRIREFERKQRFQKA